MGPSVRVVRPGSFAAEAHFYPRVLNAQIHPLVRFFLSLDRERLISRYCHLHPRVDADALRDLLATTPRTFRWAGCDLMHVTTGAGHRRMVVIETNSCPSGQKSMPLFEELDELGGYRLVLEEALAAQLTAGRRVPPGRLAVLYDKNPMEASGYAAAMAELFQEEVFQVYFPDGDPDPSARFRDGVLQVRSPEGEWIDIRCAFRYVTQRPWNRIPIRTRTLIVNPVLACLAGGRNKLVAAKAYDLLGAEVAEAGLTIESPETIWDVGIDEIPLWVRRLGGQAVIKDPYSNAGQGVTIVRSQADLDAFLAQKHPYDQFIVQSLVGHHRWSSASRSGRLYHVGTVPDRQGRLYAADLRFMVVGGADGFRPVAIYARRARTPLVAEPSPEVSSWEMLGTNLSYRREDGSWDTETERLLLMDRKDFHRLGLGLDDLVEAMVQTVLSVVAIDRMATAMTTTKGRFRRKLFRSLDDDPTLLAEIDQARGGMGEEDGWIA